jgi:hypothetical protein
LDAGCGDGKKHIWKMSGISWRWGRRERHQDSSIGSKLDVGLALTGCGGCWEQAGDAMVMGERGRRQEESRTSWKVGMVFGGPGEYWEGIGNELEFGTTM